MDLQDILSDKPVETRQVEQVEQTAETVVETPTQQAESTTQRGADGKFVAKETPKVETKVETKVEQTQQPELSPRERAFVARAQDETRKRQELERRLAEFEKPKPTEAPKQFWDDPEAALKRHQEEVAQATTNTRLQTAEIIARSRYTDFDENVKVFAEVLQSTPGLQQQWLQAADPAEFAYRTGKNHKQLSEAGNIDTLKANWEKEIRLKVEAEFAEKQKKAEAERAAIPGSLSDARGTASPKAVWGGPPSLDDVLK